MTKSAVRAMDLIQEFSKKELHHNTKGFIVSGASKRGWTTWLTGANDKRVVAIAPMVIDMLNMSVNIPYQKVVWGDYSIEIEDYVKLGLAQEFGTNKENDLVKMNRPLFLPPNPYHAQDALHGNKRPLLAGGCSKKTTSMISRETIISVILPMQGTTRVIRKGHLQHSECVSWQYGKQKQISDL